LNIKEDTATGTSRMNTGNTTSTFIVDNDLLMVLHSEKSTRVKEIAKNKNIVNGTNKRKFTFNEEDEPDNNMFDDNITEYPIKFSSLLL